MKENKLEWKKPKVLVVDLKEYENLIIANARSSCGGGSCRSCYGVGCYCGCVTLNLDPSK